VVCCQPKIERCLKLMNIFSTFLGVLTDMPHFSHKALVEKFGHKETLTYVYFLKHGRPSFAFASLMAKYQHRKYIPKTRYHQVNKQQTFYLLPINKIRQDFCLKRRILLYRLGSE
jgi:hypothetical protein